MNKSKLYMWAMAASVMSLAACSPEEYSGADMAGIPNASEYKVNVNVNQETNIASFSITDLEGNPVTGVYPVWTINADRTYNSTLDGFTTGLIAVAGDYTYSVRIANRNGMSDGELQGGFTINTTRYDFTEFQNFLTGGGTKQWRVYASQKGHMDMYAPDFSQFWWAAGPNEKAGEGMYDDRMNFTLGSTLSQGNYVYDAGEDGNTFLLSTCTNIGIDGGVGGDYSYPLVDDPRAKTDVTYSLGYDAVNQAVTITLPAGTLIPCMTHDVVVESDATYTVEQINDKTMIWSIGVPTAGWKFTFISGDDPASEKPVSPDDVNWAAATSDLNLVKAFNEAQVEFNPYWANDGWAPVTSPEYTFADGTHSLTILENNGWSQWQGQLPFVLDGVSIANGDNYDVAFNVYVSEERSNVTFKICQDVEGDTPVLIEESGQTLAEGNNLIRFAKRSLSGDGDITRIKLLIDLPGTSAGTTVALSNVLIQKHNPK